MGQPVRKTRAPRKPSVPKDTRPQWVKDLDANRPSFFDVTHAIASLTKKQLLTIAAMDSYQIVRPDSFEKEGFSPVFGALLAQQHPEAPDEPGVNLLDLMELVARELKLTAFEQFMGRRKRASQIDKDITAYVEKNFLASDSSRVV